ncbi:MAG: hypothetical protein DMG24_17555 [Acidobacteria bacterium]|nr:MAG: hypothetical protein DMG24_17555 [Acidobacteriota bacterium]
MVRQGIWILFVPMIVAALIAAPLLGGTWPGFDHRFCAGRWAPLYSTVPLGYREISRVIFKVNGMRCAVWLPLLIAYAPILAWRLNAEPTQGIVFALKAFCLVVALQPVMVLGHVSKGTNDSEGITLGRLFLLSMLGLGVFILLAAGVMTFMPDPLITVVGLAIAAFSALGFWLLYGFFYNRRLDLLRTQIS